MYLVDVGRTGKVESIIEDPSLASQLAPRAPRGHSNLPWP